MTLIAAWVGVDCKKQGNEIASIYFASDSRFSWGDNNSFSKYDEGMKVFCSRNHPYIFAYCGDVLFPLHTLERIIYKIDFDLFFDPTDNSFLSKLLAIKTEITVALKNYPSKPSFTILFASRESYYEFHLCSISSDKGTVTYQEIELPNKSEIVFVGGSGKSDFYEVQNQLLKERNPNEGTSRFCFHCVAKTIKEYESSKVGGPPQLVGLYRKGNGIIFGLEYNKKCFILGKCVKYMPQYLHIEWRNSNFERINPETLKLQEGAQAQPF